MKGITDRYVVTLAGPVIFVIVKDESTWRCQKLPDGADPGCGAVGRREAIGRYYK